MRYEKIKKQTAAMIEMNLIFPNLLLSKPKGIVSGKTKTYNVNNNIGMDPMYPNANPKPEVFPILFSLEQFFDKEL